MGTSKMGVHRLLSLGFGVVLLLLIGVAVSAYWGSRSITGIAIQGIKEMTVRGAAGAREGSSEPIAVRTRQIEKQLEEAADRTATMVSILSLVSVAFGVICVFLIGRHLNGSLKRIIQGLQEGADQVASTSIQVSSSSNALSDGATEQAASIQETSSSLEEMASMTKLNAEHAEQADALMKEAGEVVGRATGSMKELTLSMEDITRASEETSKIIKTIDEIAFQTNLLALNAAVEAARAGEAGAGFAVVADEVRNLALRAADAAKSTADLIEGTVKKVKDGSGLVTTNNEAFAKVADTAAKVAGLVAEIAAASKEQSHGIEQVNRSVAEMDKVVQQNAANAEENASASSEMNGQAEKIKVYVSELLTMVGSDTRARVDRRQGTGNRTKAIHTPRQGGAGAAQPRKSGEKGEKAAKALIFPSKAGEIRPEQIIPLKDSDFKDF